MTKLTVTEAAEFAGVSTGVLYRHLRVGNIVGNRIANTNVTMTNPCPFTWLVDKESLEQYYYSVAPGKKQHTRKQTKPQNSKIRWVNVYPNGEIDSYLFASKKQALANADRDVIITKAIEITV